MTSTTARSLVLEPQAGRLLPHFANKVRFKITGDESSGKYSIMEFELGPGVAGPPLHRHENNDEMHYVLDGTVGFQIEDQRLELGPGGLANIERGTPHTIFNPTDQPSRILIHLSPAGFERFYFDIAELTDESDGEPAPDAIGQVIARHDVIMEAPAAR